MAQNQSMTWHQAIQKVLGESPGPLHYNELTKRIIAQGLRTSLGATPASSVNATMADSIKKDGDKSPYVRTDKGVFTLRAKAMGLATGNSGPVVVAKLTPDIPESPDIEEQYKVVSSFGMFWRRDAVDWNASVKLWGKQDVDATPVDFNAQLGVYLLYDGREVIYVGRSTDRPLGKRLFEHTVDRLSTRWDRFSWFGLRPVSDKGNLLDLPKSFEFATLIPALEAILIESLEPRQNRRRGDDLEAVEYMQHVDAAIKKKRLQAAIAEI